MLGMVIGSVVVGGVVALAIYVYFRWRARRESTQVYNFRTVQPVSADTSDSIGTSDVSGDSGIADNFVAKMKASKKSMVVFYGSQTGTAEGFAYRLGKDARKYGIGALVMDPEGCPLDALAELRTLENPLVVFCVATYGEGDPTDNAQDLHEWLQQAPDAGIDLSGVNFAVFGLGNKTYENYNVIGKFVDRQMEALHAERICDLGIGDDDANIEDDFILWCERFWAGVCYKFNISPAINDDGTKGSRQYRLVEYDHPLDNLFSGEPARLRSFAVQKPPFDAKNPFLATIIDKRELHKGGERSCLHIELDISGSRMRYDAGDHLAVVPENNADLVQALGKRLGADLQRAFLLENVDPEAAKKTPFPCPTTYGVALTHYLDITSPPRTNVLRELAEYTTDEKENEFLRLISSPTDEGRAKYASWILDCRRDLLAVLEDLPNLKPSIDLICELLPRLQPRYYSIASSPKLHPTAVHITAVIIEYTTKAGRLSRGVCTTFLRDTSVGTKVPVFIRRSQFRLPFRPSVPVIMVGPGTGLAPFRGFIQDRWFARKEGKPTGDTILYFGCRRRDEDYIYEEELEAWQGDGTLSQLHLAFSREKTTKTYVQHLIRQNAADIWQLINTNRAHIYICGDASQMAPDVYSTFLDICSEHGQMERTAALEYMKRLSKQGRYSADVWS